MREHLKIGTNKRGEQGFFAEKDFKGDDIVLKLKGEVTREPTRYSIEVGTDEHITDEIGSYLNHSCEPNTEIERAKREVHARRAIAIGEEPTFDYNANETEMAFPFECRCGLKNCQRLIGGKKGK
jgi:hypothetical protein